MPLILAKPNDDGTVTAIIVLGPENIERMQEKDPVELNWQDMPFKDRRPSKIAISIVTDAEMMQMTQLARQGKRDEAIKMAISGWKFRPDLGDHDLGFEKL